MDVYQKTNSYKNSAKALLTSQRGRMHRSIMPIEPRGLLWGYKVQSWLPEILSKASKKNRGRMAVGAFGT